MAARPDVRSLLNLLSHRLRALPLLVLYITDGCNSRCVMCDIWKLPRRNMEMALAEQLAGAFGALGGRAVVLSGGEAMQHPDWPRIAGLFRAEGASVSLLTNGLALHKQARDVITHIDSVTVSLDAAAPETYRAIRGVDALPRVLAGIRAVADGGVPVTTRTTVQRANFREMPGIVDAALAAGARCASFLALDVSNPEAFGPRFDPDHLPLLSQETALTPDDLPAFAAVLSSLERTHAADFAAGRIAESPAKLRRLYDYFAAVNGLVPFKGPRCNAPHISAVIEVDGTLRPCFFLPAVGNAAETSLIEALNTPDAQTMRMAYRAGRREECERCVCPLYRGPRALLREL